MFRGSTYSLESDKDFSFTSNNFAEESIKIALVGISDVGKSSMINCMAQDKFREDLPPTRGFQLCFKKLRINNHIINLSVWDGAGDKMLQFIKEGQFKRFDGIIYVFDLMDVHSISTLEQFHHQIKQHYAEDFISVLVGNKADLLISKSISTSEKTAINQTEYHAEKFAAKNKMLYLKISAKENHFVTDCFVEIIKEVLRVKRFIRTSRLLDEEDDEKGEQNICSKISKDCSSCQCIIM